VEELLQKSGGWPELLTAGLQNADQYALCACALLGAITARDLAGYHHRTNGLLGAISQLRHFLPKMRIFFNQLPHVPKLLAPWRKISAALEAALRR
jgi:hypothetical protein